MSGVEGAWNAEARMCSPLHIRAPIKVPVIHGDQALILSLRFGNGHATLRSSSKG